jgi:hypothetical protein
MSGVPPIPLTKARTLTAFQAKVVDDRLDQHPGDVVGRRQLLAASTGLAVDPDADLHLVVGQVEVGRPAAGTMRLVSAIPIERALALTLTAVAVTSARDPPASAWHRRSSRRARCRRHLVVRRCTGVLDRDVAVGDDGRDLDFPPTSSAASWKLRTSPV